MTDTSPQLAYTYMFTTDTVYDPAELFEMKDHTMLLKTDHIMKQTKCDGISMNTCDNHTVDDKRFSRIIETIANNQKIHTMFSRQIEDANKSYTVATDKTTAIKEANDLCRGMIYDLDEAGQEEITKNIGRPTIFVRKNNVVVGIVEIGTNKIKPIVPVLIPKVEREKLMNTKMQPLTTKYPELPVDTLFPYIKSICALKGSGKSVLTIAEYIIMQFYYHLIPDATQLLYISLSPMYDVLNKVKTFYKQNGYDVDSLEGTGIKQITPSVVEEINTFAQTLKCETPDAFYTMILPLNGGGVDWIKKKKFVRMHNGSRKQVYVNSSNQEAIRVGRKYVIFTVKAV